MSMPTTRLSPRAKRNPAEGGGPAAGSGIRGASVTSTFASLPSRFTVTVILSPGFFDCR